MPKMSTAATTKRNLLAKLKAEVFNQVDFMINKLRDAVNEAMEANQRKVYESHLRVAQVIDVQNDRINALVDLLIDGGVFSEQEFVEVVQVCRDRRVEQLRAAREEIQRLREEEAVAAMGATETPLTEASMVLEAGRETPSDGPHGFHPPEVEVFGG